MHTAPQATHKFSGYCIEDDGEHPFAGLECSVINMPLNLEQVLGRNESGYNTFAILPLATWLPAYMASTQCTRQDAIECAKMANEGYDFEICTGYVVCECNYELELVPIAKASK